MELLLNDKRQNVSYMKRVTKQKEFKDRDS